MSEETEPIPGQMDVFDVLADVEENGLKPPNRTDRPTKRHLTAAEVVALRLKETE
jgi:hypothetical protein